MSEHDNLGGPKYTAPYFALVTTTADPEKLGRVKVRVPGLLEPESGWVPPLGLPGAGKNRGVFAVPKTGSTVVVVFHQGDVDHPLYIAGPLGKPGGSSEVAGPVGGYHGTDDPPTGDITAEDAPKVPAWEGDRFVVFADERAGHVRLVLRDKTSGDEIEFDGVRFGITIKATTMLRLVCDGLVDIRGAAVVINGRPVAPGSGPL